MDVILLEKIENVGGIGDKVSVKPGFARNFLLPQGKATLATADNVAKFEAQRADLVAKAQAGVAQAQARAAKLEGQTLTLTANAGPGGKLFGSIGTIDIAAACEEKLGIEVERAEIRLPEGPLRAIGEHAIELHLHMDVNVPMTIVVEGIMSESDIRDAVVPDESPAEEQSGDAP